jgi:hypothetical protein
MAEIKITIQLAPHPVGHLSGQPCFCHVNLYSPSQGAAASVLLKDFHSVEYDTGRSPPSSSLALILGYKHLFRCTGVFTDTLVLLQACHHTQPPMGGCTACRRWYHTSCHWPPPPHCAASPGTGAQPSYRSKSCRVAGRRGHTCSEWCSGGKPSPMSHRALESANHSNGCSQLCLLHYACCTFFSSSVQVSCYRSCYRYCLC